MKKKALKLAAEALRGLASRIKMFGSEVEVHCDDVSYRIETAAHQIEVDPVPSKAQWADFVRKYPTATSSDSGTQAANVATPAIVRDWILGLLEAQRDFDSPMARAIGGVTVVRIPHDRKPTE